LGETYQDALSMNPDGKNYPDVSVHYADEWKYSDGTGQNRNPNDDKSDILSDLSLGAVQSNG
jgi:hypothetical protein